MLPILFGLRCGWENFDHGKKGKLVEMSIKLVLKMKRTSPQKMLVGVLILLQSCIPPSTEPVTQLDQPDRSKIDAFGIQVSGQIAYQFYHKYGFTDIEEHLILVVQPDEPLALGSDLPMTVVDADRLKVINKSKFTKDSTLNFAPGTYAHADIRIEALEFYAGQELQIFVKSGTYEIIQTDSAETLILSDEQSGMVYIESKTVSDQ